VGDEGQIIEKVSTKLTEGRKRETMVIPSKRSLGEKGKLQKTLQEDIKDRGMNE